MDVNNSMPTQGSPNMATNSWRSQQHKELREKNVSMIINVLKQYSRPRDPAEIKNLAFTFEGRVYTVATSLEDYVHQISSNVEAYKDNALHSLPSVPPNAAENPGDQGSCNPQGQLCKPEQPFLNPMQQQAVQTMPASLPIHGRQSQLEPNVHNFISQAQSPPASFVVLPRPIHEEMQEVPMSYSLSLARRLITQRNHILQSQDAFPAQAANLKLERREVDEDTWREAIYQWFQTLKYFFLRDMVESVLKLNSSLQQMESAPQAKNTSDFLKQSDLRDRLMRLEWLLHVPRHMIDPQLKQLYATLEKEIFDLIKSPELTNMPQIMQLKQQEITKSHLREQQQSDVNVKQKRQRGMKNMQQPPLELHAQQLSGSHMNPTQVMGYTGTPPMQHHFSRQQQQPLELHAQQLSGSHMNPTQVMGYTGTTPMQHHFSRQQQQEVKPAPSPSPVSSPQLPQVPSIHPSQNPSPTKKQNLQTSPEKTGASAGPQQASGGGPDL